MTQPGGSVSIAGLGLKKVYAGLYRITGTRWAIGRTEDLIEGPRGGSHAAWELRKWDESSGCWIIDSPLAFRTLALAWAHVCAHPAEVLR